MSLYGCVTGSRYTMSASLYTETVSQDSDSGEFIREWTLEGLVPCYAAGVAASGKDTPGTFEVYTGQGKYWQSDMVRIYTRNPISKGYKVSLLTDAAGSVWTEEETGDPTIFDCNGSVPVVGANGKIIEHVSLLTRSEVQDGSIF